MNCEIRHGMEEEKNIIQREKLNVQNMVHAIAGEEDEEYKISKTG